MEEIDAIIVGAGLAGLACAVELHEAGWRVLVLESSDAVGGRVRTDEVDGFLVDRGFQVFLTAYPEARRLLDYEALDLRPYPAGARIRTDVGEGLLGDPLRAPGSLFSTIVAPLGTLMDKLRVLRWRRRVQGSKPSELLGGGRPTLRYLQDEHGFSEYAIDRFLRPFLGGIFLDAALDTSSSMADYVWRMFGEGDAAIPARGMQAIPDQLAARLPQGTIQLQSRVMALQARGVLLDDGRRLAARVVVVATDMGHAEQLTGEELQRGWNGTTCLWFAVAESPMSTPHLLLNGTGSGTISNVTVPTMIAPERSPDDRHLVSVSIIGTDDRDVSEVESQTRSELQAWFGAAVETWTLLTMQRIPNALPHQPSELLAIPERNVEFGPGLWVCGDHRDQSSIQGALRSGARTAAGILSRAESAAGGGAKQAG